MAKRTRRPSGPISAAWLGERVTLPPHIEARMTRRQWNACPSCKTRMLTEAPRLCMSCDPEYVQIQPGVFTRKQGN